VLPRRRGGSDTEFVRRVLIVIGITALAASLYKLSEVLLLIFGAMLIAVVIGPDAAGSEAVTGIHRLFPSDTLSARLGTDGSR